jgi:regulatory protein
MYINRIEQIDKKRYKIYIDYEYAFLLYCSDIRKYHIEEGMSMEPSLYEEIYKDTILRRAKQKALLLLQSMDRTQKELENKLTQLEYPRNIISQAIEYVISYGYIDDERYARNYVHYRKDTKSRKQLEFDLTRKGIAKEYIALAFEEDNSDDSTAIEKAIRKKIGLLENLEELPIDRKKKLAAFLYRKGFTSDIINRYIQF